MVANVYRPVSKQFVCRCALNLSAALLRSGYVCKITCSWSMRMSRRIDDRSDSQISDAKEFKLFSNSSRSAYRFSRESLPPLRRASLSTVCTRSSFGLRREASTDNVLFFFLSIGFRHQRAERVDRSRAPMTHMSTKKATTACCILEQQPKNGISLRNSQPNCTVSESFATQCRSVQLPTRRRYHSSIPNHSACRIPRSMWLSSSWPRLLSDCLLMQFYSDLLKRRRRLKSETR